MEGPCDEYGFCQLLEPGGQLTAAAWLDDRRMYLADWEGRIRLLDVTTGAVETVLEGLSIPQGLTVLAGRLYVSDMGNVCGLFETAEEKRLCRTNDRWQIDILLRASAQILSYRIGEDGSLDDRQVVVDRLLSHSRDHSPQGLANDGEYVYVSIGHPFESLARPDGGPIVQGAEQIAAAGGRTDLMGVIARFRPAAAGQTGAVQVQVYATGLRNTYGISIAPDGTIYGGDNDTSDGRTEKVRPGEQLEELNAIIKDGFYGYPFYGTSEAPPEANVTEPVAVLPGVASTFAHANESGVYVAYLAVGEGESGFVVDRFDYETFTPTRIFSFADSYVTAILEREGLLYLVSFSGKVHVIDPRHTDILPPERQLSSESLAEIIEEEPVLRFGYAVYIAEGRLIYVRTPCERGNAVERIFLHLYPVDRKDLPEWRQQYGFANLDFTFDLGAAGSDRKYKTRRIGEHCAVVQQLPDYDLRYILTGLKDRFSRRAELDLE